MPELEKENKQITKIKGETLFIIEVIIQFVAMVIVPAILLIVAHAFQIPTTEILDDNTIKYFNTVPMAYVNFMEQAGAVLLNGLTSSFALIWIGKTYTNLEKKKPTERDISKIQWLKSGKTMVVIIAIIEYSLFAQIYPFLSKWMPYITTYISNIKEQIILMNIIIGSAFILHKVVLVKNKAFKNIVGMLPEGYTDKKIDIDFENQEITDKELVNTLGKNVGNLADQIRNKVENEKDK